MDRRVVEDFGKEWSRFDQTELNPAEYDKMFLQYFSVFPWDLIAAEAAGLDVGCGSGRWARLVAPRVGRLICLDPSEAALRVAQRSMATQTNVDFCLGSADSLPFPAESLDFAYSLGVLHHTWNIRAGIEEIARVLKPGAPLLVYLYYRFDNRPAWFRGLWKASDLIRRALSRSPSRLRFLASEVIAAVVYAPLAFMARLGEAAGLNVQHWPLSAYRYRSFYSMRTDALDRFGTRLEQRLTRAEIESLMRAAGLDQITFREGEPYWTAVGYK